MHISSATPEFAETSSLFLKRKITFKVIVGASCLDRTFPEVDVFSKPMFHFDDVGGKVNVHSLLSASNRVHGSKFPVLNAWCEVEFIASWCAEWL